MLHNCTIALKRLHNIWVQRLHSTAVERLHSIAGLPQAIWLPWFLIACACAVLKSIWLGFGLPPELMAAAEGTGNVKAPDTKLQINSKLKIGENLRPNQKLKFKIHKISTTKDDDDHWSRRGAQPQAFVSGTTALACPLTNSARLMHNTGKYFCIFSIVQMVPPQYPLVLLTWWTTFDDCKLFTFKFYLLT